jgi:GPI mannosyltransferase 3
MSISDTLLPQPPRPPRAWKAVLHHSLTDPSPAGVLNRSLVILALFTVSTAWVSDLYFWPDEHWQVLEFMGFKLGITPASELPWEFASRVRSWMQPFLYWLIAKPLLAAGLTDMFQVVFVLRLATGALSFTAIAAFARLFQSDLTRTDEKFAFARMLPFMGFLPYLAVRTASETAAMAFFTLGLVVAVKAARVGAWRSMAGAGALCALAFETRFQSALLTGGLLVWLILVMRARKELLGAFVAGGLAVVAAALVIDRWGYGVWTFPVWNYFDIVLWQGLAARASGAQPFFAFFYLLPANIFAPIAAFALIALIVACLRNPTHYVTWPVALFFLAHCFLFAHKEERFLFPLAILATAFPVLAFSPAPERAFAFFGKAWSWRKSILAQFVGWSAAAAMLFCAIYPFGIRPHMPMAKYLYRHFPAGISAYTFEDAVFLTYPLYRPPHYASARLTGIGELTARLADGPVYLFAETPTLAPGLLPAGVKAEILYSEFPFAMDPKLAPSGTNWMCTYAYLRQHSFVHPPRLAWMTLYKLTRGGANTAQPSPCLPKWNVAL